MQTAGPVRHTDQGDRRARFELVYAANYEHVLAYALRRTDTRDDAADVVAETFLTAWRRDEQAPDGPTVRLWLYGIARRVLANHLRGRRRYERLGARLRANASESGRTSSSRVTDTDASGAVAAAFARLNAGDRDILALVGAEGLTPGEAARVLGCRAATVRVRLHRARARFARELATEGVQV
jgi:RNA polymerase sigma-70 factor (ECF subfamily)